MATRTALAVSPGWPPALETGQLPARRFAGCPHTASSERDNDQARLPFGEATRRLAVDAVGADTADSALEQTRPHALVNTAGVGPCYYERPERAGSALQDRRVALERLHRGVKAERSECIADSREAGTDVARRLQAGSGTQAATKLLARFSESSGPAAGRNLPEEETDQLREPPIRELEPFELGRDPINLGRAAGSGSALASQTLECHGQKSGGLQPIEAAACDVAVNAEDERHLARGKWLAPASRVEKHPAKLGVAGRCKAVERRSGALERHRADTLPAPPTCENSDGAKRDWTKGGCR
jgi:hypothetical protein